MTAAGIESIAENYLNGNLSDVRGTLAALPPLIAACVALQVYSILPVSEAGAWLNRLCDWADR